MSSDQQGGGSATGPNRTVFRPSPLQGAKQGSEPEPSAGAVARSRQSAEERSSSK